VSHWLFKLGGACILALLVVSGALHAAGVWSLAGVSRALPWSAPSSDVQGRYAAVVPPPWSNTDTVISEVQKRLRADAGDERSYV